MSLRVLLVTSEFPPDIGGVGSHVLELARGLTTAIDKVVVVHPQGPGFGPIPSQREDFPVERPRLFKGEPFYQFLLHRWLVRRLAREPFDLVHVHGMRPLGATRDLPASVIFTNHTSGFLDRVQASPWRRMRTAGLLKHLAFVIAPSDELIEASRALGYRGPAAMIPNGVDPARFSPGASHIRSRLGIGEDEIVVLLARRLAEKNGIVWFARALGSLRSRNVRVLVAGDGEERAPMQIILAENGMLERTIFLGSVANQDMPPIYRAADISVLPSLAEATSISGLEAMATGLPLVGTRVGGIPTIIEDEATGLLVPPRDPETMAVALDRLVLDADMRRRMGAAARAKVEREFAWPAIVRRTVDVYRSCAEAA
ncbi:MAG TPA: glycosyltransferase family 4 protein [Rhizomicrobium sp.]|nr:glycosyltransferase family 4 protein [Rhizomicrobium sp.]